MAYGGALYSSQKLKVFTYHFKLGSHFQTDLCDAFQYETSIQHRPLGKCKVGSCGILTSRVHLQYSKPVSINLLNYANEVKSI